MTLDELISQNLPRDVALALAEDVGSGDITAQLINVDDQGSARLITREAAILCGQAWVNEVYRQVDPKLKIHWHAQDGNKVEPGQTLFSVTGNARAILTGERPALNFLQTLSGTATAAHHYAAMIAHTQAKILDTRKTLPGLRFAQKYAARCGGCQNHRLGLWDAFLIKENHIMACGGISKAVKTAQLSAPGKPVEVEVESLAQLREAMEAGADIVMLDNFDLTTMAEAVNLAGGKVKLEASGGIDDKTLVAIAETGVDFISIGAITKHCRALDLSMRMLDKS